jgi:cytochrome c peroxidase
LKWYFTQKFSPPAFIHISAIPANADPGYFDLGLCGPDRLDFADRSEYCGLFKTPSLRNVALRPAFFHNGVFSSLRDAVAFYADRDIHPERWYPVNPDGSVSLYADLPAQYHQNVDVEAPFNRRPGDAPALTERDIADITAFLATLTDGFAPTRAQPAIVGRAPDSLSPPRGTR